MEDAEDKHIVRQTGKLFQILVLTLQVSIRLFVCLTTSRQDASSRM